MDVTFSSAELARLCNSERLLTRQFGDQLGRTIARRLWDLAAVDADALDRLPEVGVEAVAAAETQLSFGDSVLIRGVVSVGRAPRTGVDSDGDAILITSVNVNGDEVR